MKKLFAILCISILICSQALAVEWADAMPLPKNYKSLPLREMIAEVSQSQADYEQANNGSTIFHHELFPNLKRNDYKYKCPWNAVFIAWIFKKCGIYEPTFANYSAIRKDTIEKRFMTAGNTDGSLAYAYFDYNYISNAKPGDLIFLDKYRLESSDYEDLSFKKRRVSQIAILLSYNQGTLTVISPCFQNKVWKGELDVEHNLHSPYKITGFGVIDAKPTKELVENIKTPLIAYERSSGRKFIIYYIYKDGTCLTSNGERNTSDFIESIPDKIETKMSAKMRSLLHVTSKGQAYFGKLPDMTEFSILAKENGRIQIIVPWELRDGKAKFPIYTTAWIDDKSR